MASCFRYYCSHGHHCREIQLHIPGTPIYRQSNVNWWYAWSMVFQKSLANWSWPLRHSQNIYTQCLYNSYMLFIPGTFIKFLLNINCSIGMSPVSWCGRTKNRLVNSFQMQIWYSSALITGLRRQQVFSAVYSSWNGHLNPITVWFTKMQHLVVLVNNTCELLLSLAIGRIRRFLQIIDLWNATIR